METGIRFLLLSQSLIKRAHPHVTPLLSQDGRGGVTQRESATGEQTGNTIQNYRGKTGVFRIKAIIIQHT